MTLGAATRNSALATTAGQALYNDEQARIRATLARVARGCDARSVLAFDLVRKRFASGEIDDASDIAARDRVAQMGEPLRFGTNDVVPFLYEAGFRKVSVQSFDAIVLNLTGTYSRERKFRFQSLVRASVCTPVT